MDCFDNFDPLEGDVPLYPFFNLLHIAFEAREILEGLSSDEVRRIERDVDSTIEDFGDYLIKLRAKRGGLSDEELDAYIEEFSDVDLFGMAVDCGQLSSYPGSPGYYHPDKNAAVLTLMFVARCIETLECSEEDLGTCDEGPTAARLISAANEAIEAAAALGLTRKYRYVNEISEDFALDAAENNKISDSEISETLIKAALSKIGRAGAAEKLSNDKRQHAKNQVSLKWKEWQANPKLYDNDSAFALVMVNEWTGVLRSQPVITGWCRAWRKIL